MMSLKRRMPLRILVIVVLVLLLAVQFELGMAVNLSPNIPTLPPFPFSINAITNALQQIGQVALVHASVGGLLAILSLVNLIMALVIGPTSVRIFGVLAFISTLLAAYTGAYFVLSGFQNDGLSHGMATNFLLTFIFYFLELYFLKPDYRVQKTLT
jgi:hypothetical protein